MFHNTGLQKAFDRDWSRGSITQERWFPNASDEGILAYKLLVQTGHVDNPIDKSLITQVNVIRVYEFLGTTATHNFRLHGPSRKLHVSKSYILRMALFLIITSIGGGGGGNLLEA